MSKSEGQSEAGNAILEILEGQLRLVQRQYELYQKGLRIETGMGAPSTEEELLAHIVHLELGIERHHEIQELGKSRPTVWTVDHALADPLIEVVDRDDDAGHYTLRVRGLSTLIQVILTLNPKIGRVTYTVSHLIKTPGMAEPYRPKPTAGRDDGDALHKAISGLVAFYRAAERKGQTPEESWLIPNA